MSKKLLRKKLALMLANLKKKRPYYCECEFLESTGTQYIDTGYYANNTTDLEIDVYQKTYSTKQSTTLFGASNYNYQNNAFAIATYAGGCFNFGMSGTQTGFPVPAEERHTYKLNNVGAYKDGVLIKSTSSYSITGSTTYSLLLFASHWYSGPTEYGVVKCYSCKIWDNNVLVRDFIPVLDWDMTPCMYDRVTEQLFYNEGTGNFIAGRQIHPVDYLESTGTQYIDTGALPKAGATSAKFGFALTELATSAIGIFGSRASAAPETGQTYNLFSGTPEGTNRIRNDWSYKASTAPYMSGNYRLSNVLTANTLIEVELNADSSSKIDGGEFSQAGLAKYNCNYSMLIGSINTAGNVFASKPKAKWYYCKIWDNDTLVRDYIPAIDENGVAYLFDRVTHTIYDNAGQGSFKYPAREVEYLKSDGVSFMYINPNIAYFPDFEVGVKCDANTDRNVTLGVNENNMLERLNANQPYWTLHASGTVFMSNVEVGTYADAKYKDGIFSVNGTVVGTKDNKFPAGGLYLFRAPATENVYKMSVYFFKAWDNNGAIIRDFIPSYKDGQAGMWDKVNNVFYPNAGTGTFTTGKIVESEYE